MSDQTTELKLCCQNCYGINTKRSNVFTHKRHNDVNSFVTEVPIM